MKFYPPLMLLAAILSQLGIAYFVAMQLILSPLWQYMGVVLMALGFTVIVLVARHFGKAETTILPDGQPSRLMEDGLFAYSRNPIYVAMSVLLCGTGLATGNLWGLSVVPVFIVAVQRIWIVKEEENLEAEFGQIYRNYKLKVRRWL